MKAKPYSFTSFVFVGILVCLSANITAQSASFSQFLTTRMYLNPALTGLEPGVAGTVAYREQWTNVPGGLRTVFAGFDARCGQSFDGVGVTFLSNTEGEGFLKTTEINAQYARIIPLTGYSNKRGKVLFDLHLGVRVGWGNKRIDWPRLVFSDQLHPVLGQILPQSPGAVPILQSKSYFNNGLGACVRFSTGVKRSKKVKLTGQVGLAVSNLFRTNESLQQLGTLLPTKYTVHADVDIPVMPKIGRIKAMSLAPSIKFDFQGGINSLAYGMFATYDNLYVGAFYQNTYLTYDLNNTSAFIFMGGMKFQIGQNEWKIGYSYDTNPSGLGLRSFGVHELTLRYSNASTCLFKKIKNFRNRSGISCPVFN
jgi:type IX secretion system PorP/SprF family membrane protein